MKRPRGDGGRSVTLYGAAFERWHRKNCPVLRFGGGGPPETCSDVEARDGPEGLVLAPWGAGMLTPEIEERFWDKSCVTVYEETRSARAGRGR